MSPKVDSNTAGIATLSSIHGILYVGTHCGKLLAFSVETLSRSHHAIEKSGNEDITDGRNRRKSSKKLTETTEKRKLDEYEKQLVADVNSCAISVHMHQFSMSKILCLSLPTLSQSKVHDSLVLTVGNGFHHHSMGSDKQTQLQSSLQCNTLDDCFQLLVWGYQKDGTSTSYSF